MKDNNIYKRIVKLIRNSLGIGSFFKLRNLKCCDTIKLIKFK